MFKKNREVSVFSMSTLDVLFGALGAFTILMLTLFPFQGRFESEYQRRSQVAVFIEWEDEGADVDLYLKRPDGTFMGPKSGSMGAAAVTQIADRVGPAKESAWTVSASEGEYEVIYRLEGGSSARVRGWLIAHGPDGADSEGRYQITSLGTRRLSGVGRQVTQASFALNVGDLEAPLLSSLSVSR